MHYWQESDIQVWLTYAAFPVTNKKSALTWAIHKYLLKKDTLLN